MKVGYISKRRDSCFVVRCLNPMSQFNANGYNFEDEVFEQILRCADDKCENFQQTYLLSYQENKLEEVKCDCGFVLMTAEDRKTWHESIEKILCESDIVVFQRPIEIEHLKLVKKAKAMGKVIVQSADDHYLDIPESNPGYTHYTARRGIIEETFRLCDAMDVTTPYLKNAYSKYCKDVEILPNSLDIELLDAQPPLREPIVFKKDGSHMTLESVEEMRRGKKFIMWGGSPTHEKDLELIVGAVRRVVRTENVCFGFVGYAHRALIEQIPDNRLALFSLVSNDVYYMLYKAIKPDIGLAPVIDHPFNHGKCVVGETLISTNDGVVRIDSISKRRIKDSIDKKANGRVFSDGVFEKYNGFYYGGKQNCIKLKTKYGYEITATKEHRILSNGKWKAMVDFSVGDTVDLSDVMFFSKKFQEIAYPLFLHSLISKFCLDNFISENSPKVRINEDWGRFLGYMVGDGTVNGYNRMGISCSTDYPDIINDVIRLVKSFGLHPFISIKKDKRITNEDGSVKTGKGRDIIFTSRMMVRFLYFLGVCGKRQKKLIVPDVILKSPKSVIREFLSGLFEADGTVGRRSCIVSFTTKSKDLVKTVQFLLLGFGIKSKIIKQKIQLKTWSNGRQYWTLILNSKSSRIFQDEIGFISEKKKKILKERCEMPKGNHFDDWKWKDEVCEIVNIKRKVFDICVPSIKRYVANGFISHNSNLKLLEYSVFNALPVASDLVTYHGFPGAIYAKNDEYSWFKALRQAINCEGEELKQRLASNRKYVEKEFDMKNTWVLWEKFYKRLLEKRNSHG